MFLFFSMCVYVCTVCPQSVCVYTCVSVHLCVQPWMWNGGTLIVNITVKPEVHMVLFWGNSLVSDGGTVGWALGRGSKLMLDQRMAHRQLENRLTHTHIHTHKPPSKPPAQLLFLFYYPWNGACSKYYLLCFIPVFRALKGEKERHVASVTFSFSKASRPQQRWW